MSHDSWIILPLISLAEDGHTIAPINPWKFQSDWSSHVRAYKEHSTGNGPSPHTPLYTYASCAGWIMILGNPKVTLCKCKAKSLYKSINVPLHPMTTVKANMFMYKFSCSFSFFRCLRKIQQLSRHTMKVTWSKLPNGLLEIPCKKLLKT